MNLLLNCYFAEGEWQDIFCCIQKTVWEDLKITNQTLFIILFFFPFLFFKSIKSKSHELLPETRISSLNSCHIWDQNTYFSELFRVEWCTTAVGVKIIPQRTLIKGERQRLSAGACRTPTESHISVIDNTHTHSNSQRLRWDAKVEAHVHTHSLLTFRAIQAFILQQVI